MTTYTVRARRWVRGWELHIDGVGVTQVRALQTAEATVRDYVESLLDIDASDAQIHLVLEDDGIQEQVNAARAATDAAAAAQEVAAARARQVAAHMENTGMSRADIAAILHVAPSRVTQMLGANRSAHNVPARRQPVTH